MPDTVIATYRVRPDREAAFRRLLASHHPTLLSLGLVTPEPPVVYRGEGPTFYEVFTWKDADAPGIAHETPAVARVWEAMGTMVEERGGKPKWEFPHVERLDLSLGPA